MLALKNLIQDFWKGETGRASSDTTQSSSGSKDHIADASKQKVTKCLLEALFEEHSYFFANSFAHCLALIAKNSVNAWDGLLDQVCEELANEDEPTHVDAALRVLMNFLQEGREEYASIVGKVLENLFTAFTNPEADSKLREKCLEVYHLSLRCVSWADGIEEETV